MSAIKTIKVTKYEYKGILYDTEAQAKAAYESNRAKRSYLIFDTIGEIVTNPSNATFVYLPTAEDAEDFIGDCEEQDSISEGIYQDCTGLYIWNQFDYKYEWFDCDYYKGMERILHKINNIK